MANIIEGIKYMVPRGGSIVRNDLYKSLRIWDVRVLLQSPTHIRCAKLSLDIHEMESTRKIIQNHVFVKVWRGIGFCVACVLPPLWYYNFCFLRFKLVRSWLELVSQVMK